MIFISIIIPIYNAEKHLTHCIETLENQDIENNIFEILAINDGSIDNSIHVIKELANKYDNIQIIDQANQGVSVARNVGIKNAKGKYIMFIDADDFVEENFLKGVIKRINDFNFPEVVFLGYNILDDKGIVTNKLSNRENAGIIYDGIEAYPISRGDGKLNPDRCWAILFDRQLIINHSIYFVPGIPYLEDGEFIARLLSIANRCLFYGNVFYNRTSMEGSAVNSPLFYSERAGNGFLLASKNLIEFQKNKNLTLRQKLFLNQPICKFILLVLMPVCSFSNFRQFRNRLAIMRKQGIGKINLNSCKNIYLIEGRLFNISPYILYAHRILRSPLVKLLA